MNLYSEEFKQIAKYAMDNEIVFKSQIIKTPPKPTECNHLFYADDTCPNDEVCKLCGIKKKNTGVDGSDGIGWYWHHTHLMYHKNYRLKSMMTKAGVFDENERENVLSVFYDFFYFFLFECTKKKGRKNSPPYEFLLYKILDLLKYKYTKIPRKTKKKRKVFKSTSAFYDRIWQSFIDWRNSLIDYINKDYSNTRYSLYSNNHML